MEIEDLVLVVATGNLHKIVEIKQILGNEFIRVLPYSEVFEEKMDVVEDGDTFEENAIKKVNAFPATEGMVILAEDSGLCVDYLDGGPGIYSARYAGEGASCEEMCHKLLREIYGAGTRDAHYVAVMALKFPDGRVETVRGEFFGSISHEMTGENGFGYDPVFVPEGEERTCGEMDSAEKNLISHRAKALGALKRVLEVRGE